MSSADPRPPEDHTTPTAEGAAPDEATAAPVAGRDAAGGAPCANCTPSEGEARRLERRFIGALVAAIVVLLVGLVAFAGLRSDRPGADICERVGAHHGRPVGADECARWISRMQHRLDRAHERIGPRGERRGDWPWARADRGRTGTPPARRAHPRGDGRGVVQPDRRGAADAPAGAPAPARPGAREPQREPARE